MKLQPHHIVEQLKAKHSTVTVRDCVLLLTGALVVLGGFLTGHIIQGKRVPLKVEQPSISIQWLPATVTHWSASIQEMARKYNVDPNLIAIIVTVESGGDAQAQSEAGAKGLMQITPPTAGDIAKKYLKQPRTTYDLLDPRTNIEFGTAYIAYLRDQFGTAAQGPSWNSTVELIAAGYNGGPGAANRLEQGKGLTDTQTVVYSRDVFNMWRERQAPTSPTFDRWVERGGSVLLDQAKAAQQ